MNARGTATGTRSLTTFSRSFKDLTAREMSVVRSCASVFSRVRILIDGSLTEQLYSVGTPYGVSVSRAKCPPQSLIIINLVLTLRCGAVAGTNGPVPVMCGRPLFLADAWPSRPHGEMTAIHWGVPGPLFCCAVATLTTPHVSPASASTQRLPGGTAEASTYSSVYCGVHTTYNCCCIVHIREWKGKVRYRRHSPWQDIPSSFAYT